MSGTLPSHSSVVTGSPSCSPVLALKAVRVTAHISEASYVRLRRRASEGYSAVMVLSSLSLWLGRDTESWPNLIS